MALVWHFGIVEIFVPIGTLLQVPKPPLGIIEIIFDEPESSPWSPLMAVPLLIDGEFWEACNPLDWLLAKLN